MKYKQAMKIIERMEKGYMVSFEVMDGSVLRSDHFPDLHAKEPLIPTEAEAWKLAERFANATGDDVVNVYVVDNTFSPVPGYSSKKLNTYSLGS
jgi:hypothetical protein